MDIGYLLPTKVWNTRGPGRDTRKYTRKEEAFFIK